MSVQDKVVYLGNQAPGGLLQRLRQLSSGRLMALTRHMLDQVDDALFERAERAENNAVQTVFFDAMREVRLQRREIERRMEQELANRHERPVPPSEADGDDDAELALVDNEHLEERLAVEGMVSKARARYAYPLGNLVQRLNKAVGRDIHDLHLAPVAPAQVGGAFQVATSVLEIDLRARLIIYKLFDRHVMTQLGGLYDELNRMLVDAGILPEIKPTARVQPSAAARAQPMPGALPAGASPRTSEQLSDGQADALFSTLQQLVAAQKDGASSEWSGVGYASVAGSVDLSSVITVLSGLQSQAASLGFDSSGHGANVLHLDATALKDQLRLKLSGNSGGGLGRVEDDTIDIVSLLFDAILDDPALPDAIKAQIARLQIPVLKVALLDRALFSQRKHPARRLINEMAQAGIGWTESGQGGGDPLFRRIESTVTYVLEQFNDDVGVFERCLAEFRQFLAEDRERTRQIEERTRQAAEGKAKVDGAKEHVEQELRRRIGHRQVPPVVSRIVDEAWSKVLFITLLKEGDDSETWRNHLDTVERLLWSVQPKGDHAERKRLVAEIPGLLHDLRAGLNAIMFNPVEMTRLFKDLEREHIRLLSAPARSTESEQPAVEAPVSAEPDIESGDRGWVTPELQPFCQKLDEARIGTWFEFQQDNGKPIRAKLSARLAGGDRLIFVNRAGFKLADRRRDELAGALKRGRVIMLDDNLLFDKALESVVANLRSLRESQGEH